LSFFLFFFILFVSFFSVRGFIDAAVSDRWVPWLGAESRALGDHGVPIAGMAAEMRLVRAGATRWSWWQRHGLCTGQIWSFFIFCSALFLFADFGDALIFICELL
jgi:hypothetical protein